MKSIFIYLDYYQNKVLKNLLLPLFITVNKLVGFMPDTKIKLDNLNKFLNKKHIIISIKNKEII